MVNIETLKIQIDDLDPKTKVDIIMRNGALIELNTPLPLRDFLKIWKKKRRKIKLITGKDSFADINKHFVVYYHLSPITK